MRWLPADIQVNLLSLIKLLPLSKKILIRKNGIIILIDINPQGWFYASAAGEKITVDKNDFSITVDSNKILFDAVLIALHGTPGEDGKLQGYFDCLDIPYTSCDAATSALTFNKRYTVAVAALWH